MMRRRNPDVHILADLRHADGVKAAFGSDTYLASVLYSKGEWIRTHRDVAARLARAIVRTLAWMQTHSPEEIAARTPAAFRGEDDALYIDALRSAMPMFSPDGSMSRDGAEAVRTILAESMDNVRSARIDVGKTYTNEFVR
jgi:NitT/TauT family transport system substrate-binding protein